MRPFSTRRSTPEVVGSQIRGSRRPTLRFVNAPREQDAAPEQFRSALRSMRTLRPRSEILIDEAPAPQRLAPHAVALTADVVIDEEEIATGRFVLLHDPEGHSSWHGTFRVVTFVRADVEPEMAADPFAHEVGWSWLSEALQTHDCRFDMLGGTVTQVRSQSFGELAERNPEAHLEVRASWTPEGVSAPTNMGQHLAAWLDLLSTAAGLQSLPPGVAAIAMQSRRR